jgi:acetyl esterase/lipase
MEPKTVTYKLVGSLEIKLNLYVPSISTSSLPILVWFHGGGLLQGSRSRVATHMVNGVSKYGFALVSADYRLAPQVTVAEILTDVQDCLKFVYDKLPKHTPTGIALDTSRIIVSGSSAGGYLSLLAGLYSKVKIRAILAIYPITNPYGKFFTNPQPIPESHIDQALVAPYLDRNAEAAADSDAESTRNKFYFYMMQEANLASLLSIKPGEDTFIISEQLKKRRSFLPCFIVHGDADRYVGVEQADEVVNILKNIGADYDYERLMGVDHLFDIDEKVQMENMYTFMAKHL